jgi:hypothetical protein
MNGKHLRIFAWGLTALTSLLSLIAWGQLYEWQLEALSLYQLFPLLGLLAFSIMWSHYIAAAVRLHLRLDKAVLRSYFEITSLAVLALILLHPGILGWQLWQDGFGLPPGSYQTFGGPLYSFLLFGVLSLLIFLAYETRRKFQTKSWWHYVEYASDVAMLLIIVHSLKLGSHLQDGWLRFAWIFYGMSYLGALLYIYSRKFTKFESIDK